MKKLIALLVVAAFAIPLLADKYEDSGLKLSLEIPEGFESLAGIPGEDQYLGEIKAIYLAGDVTTSNGSVLVHHMKQLPGGVTDFDAFKQGLSGNLGTYLGTHYKEIKLETLKDHDGFFLEFECMGSQQGPDPNGDIPLHIRWHIVKKGDGAIGILYASNQENWKTLEPKYSASFKTAKIDK